MQCLKNIISLKYTKVKHKFIFPLVLLISFFIVASCLKQPEQKPMYRSFATLIKEGKGYFFDLDTGEKLIPTKSLNIKDSIDSLRVIITYNIISRHKEKDESIKIEADVQNIQQIFTQEIIQLTTKTIDSIGNDKLIISYKENIWLTHHYLNVLFSYYGGYKKHLVNLAKPIGAEKDEKGNLILELRHNAFEDSPSTRIDGIISFSLKNLQIENSDSINFVLKAIDGDTINFEYYGTYYPRKKN